MPIKYKSRRVLKHKNRNTKLRNNYRPLNNTHEEDDGSEKAIFNTKGHHFDKVNLIISNLENKKHNKTHKRSHGHYNISYRHYKRGFN
jgi:hypothetical protein